MDKMSFRALVCLRSVISLLSERRGRSLLLAHAFPIVDVVLVDVLLDRFVVRAELEGGRTLGCAAIIRPKNILLADRLLFKAQRTDRRVLRPHFLRGEVLALIFYRI